MSRGYTDPTPADFEEAKCIILAGYHQTSRSYRMVARLPAGKTGIEALSEAATTMIRVRGVEGTRKWAEGLGEGHAGDHYLSCHAPKSDQLTLTVPVFAAFRKLGGGTYTMVHYMRVTPGARETFGRPARPEGA